MERKLNPFEEEVLSEMRELVGDEADELVNQYRQVINNIDDSIYPDEIAENIIHYNKKGVSPQEWLKHILNNKMKAQSTKIDVRKKRNPTKPFNGIEVTGMNPDLIAVLGKSSNIVETLLKHKYRSIGKPVSHETFNKSNKKYKEWQKNK